MIDKTKFISCYAEIRVSVSVEDNGTDDEGDQLMERVKEKYHLTNDDEISIKEIF